MNTHYLQVVDDSLVPVELKDGPYFHTWDANKNKYIKTKYLPVNVQQTHTDGLEIADTLIKAISGPTIDHESIRRAKEKFVSIVNKQDS